MTTGLIRKTVEPPDLTALLRSLRADVFAALNAVKVGTIVSYDAEACTAKVQLASKRVRPDGSASSVAPLLDCPVLVIQGGGVGVRGAIAAGDECVVLFSDHNLDAWFETGGETQTIPYDNRKHDMSDGVALVGLNSKANLLTLALAADEGGIADAVAKVAVKDGLVTIANDATTLAEALADLITALSSLSVNTSTGIVQPATVTLLQAVQVKLDLLLY